MHLKFELNYFRFDFDIFSSSRFDRQNPSLFRCGCRTVNQVFHRSELNQKNAIIFLINFSALHNLHISFIANGNRQQDFQCSFSLLLIHRLTHRASSFLHHAYDVWETLEKKYCRLNFGFNGNIIQILMLFIRRAKISFTFSHVNEIA